MSSSYDLVKAYESPIFGQKSIDQDLGNDHKAIIMVNKDFINIFIICNGPKW